MVRERVALFCGEMFAEFKNLHRKVRSLGIHRKLFDRLNCHLVLFPLPTSLPFADLGCAQIRSESDAEGFQGGGLNGGSVQLMESGFVVDSPDLFRQPGRDMVKTNLQRFNHRVLQAFLNAFLM